MSRHHNQAPPPASSQLGADVAAPSGSGAAGGVPPGGAGAGVGPGAGGGTGTCPEATMGAENPGKRLGAADATGATADIRPVTTNRQAANHTHNPRICRYLILSIFYTILHVGNEAFMLIYRQMVLSFGLNLQCLRVHHIISKNG